MYTQAVLCNKQHANEKCFYWHEDFLYVLLLTNNTRTRSFFYWHEDFLYVLLLGLSSLSQTEKYFLLLYTARTLTTQTAQRTKLSTGKTRDKTKTALILPQHNS